MWCGIFRWVGLLVRCVWVCGGIVYEVLVWLFVVGSDCCVCVVGVGVDFVVG